MARFPSFSSLKVPLLILVFTIIGIGIGGGALYFFVVQKTPAKQSNTTIKPENQKLLDKLATLIDFPDETPTIAVVSDVEKLRNQDFFARAENGDRVFVFVKTKRAVLYRPSSNKIIDVSYYSADQVAQISPTPAPQQILGETTTATKSAKVLYVAPTPVTYHIDLRNGTEIAGLTKHYESELTSKLAGSSIVARDYALARNYDRTILIAAPTAPESEMERIAAALDIIVSPLPAGEAPVTAGADFAIIIGTDKQP